jgi:6-phosphogluconate dehydrogenase
MHKSQFPIELADVAHLWNQASVVRSWLCELAERAFRAEGNDLADLKGYVSDSGEGRWTIMAAIDEGVPAPVLTEALYTRFASRGHGEYANKVMSAQRFQFGGHHEKPATGEEGDPGISPR